jgi:hypothetical protein
MKRFMKPVDCISGKTSCILFMVLASGYLVSCDKTNDIVDNPTNSMDTEYYEMDFTVKASDLSGFQIFSEDTYTFDINALLAQAGLERDQVEEVVLKEASMSMKANPDYPDFNMLGSIELTVYTDQLGETSVALADPVPADHSAFYLQPEDANILPYFLKGSFMITVQGLLKERVYKDLDLQAKVKFRVKWKL